MRSEECALSLKKKQPMSARWSTPTFHTFGQKLIIFLSDNYRLQAISVDKNRFKSIIFKILPGISSSDSSHHQEKPHIWISDFCNFPAYF